MASLDSLSPTTVDGSSTPMTKKQGRLGADLKDQTNFINKNYDIKVLGKVIVEFCTFKPKKREKYERVKVILLLIVMEMC